MSKIASQKLGPPCAGIPWYHKLILRLYVKPFVANKGSLERPQKSFEMITRKILQDFKNFAELEFPKLKVLDLNSKNAYRHPWFGQMTGRKWHWLMGAHQGIHLKQIRQIKTALQKVPS